MPNLKTNEYKIMSEDKYKFKVQILNNRTLDIPLTEGKALFVLGANGVGKSTLMHNLFQQNINHSKRILAQRQTWFNDNSLSMTASQKTTYDGYIRSSDSQINSRWRVDYSQERSSISIFDLINSENVRARKIANEVDNNNIDSAKMLSNLQSPLQGINELLAISNIPISYASDQLHIGVD
jgi:ABC-type cobalamin/Fe3+-siderophores transport system ATPase subunit